MSLLSEFGYTFVLVDSIIMSALRAFILTVGGISIHKITIAVVAHTPLPSGMFKPGTWERGRG